MKISPKLIHKELNKVVIGQEEAKKTMSCAMFIHFVKFVQSLQLKKEVKKTNTLLLGPSGSGKTLLVREAAKIMQRLTNTELGPVLEVDCTSLSARGWVGDDLNELLEDHYKEHKSNDAIFNSSIIFLDEIDKLCMAAVGQGGTDHNKHTQYNLLKAVEGSEIRLPNSKKVIDTSKMMFVFAGNFPQIRHADASRKKPQMGFTERKDKSVKNKSVLDVHNKLEEGGMITQLVGRITSVAELQPLQKKDIRKILTDITIPEYLETFDFMGYELGLTRKDVNAIAETAWNRKVGARGLQSALEEYLFDHLYELQFDVWEGGKSNE